MSVITIAVCAALIYGLFAVLRSPFQADEAERERDYQRRMQAMRDIMDHSSDPK